MSGKTEVKVPENIRLAWDEARECADLIKKGKARIVIATRRDGSTYRYTKLK